MFSSNSIKFFVICALLACQACQSCQSKSDAVPTPAPFVVEEIKSEIPFLTREPENYQAEIVVTTGDVEDKTFSARNGANRLTIFDLREKSELALLQIGANQSFLINHNRKIYTVNQTESDVAGSEILNNFPTAELLNQTIDARFELLGTENNLTKYRVRLDDAPNSEIIIFADEKIGLPVRQEFYSLSGEQRILSLTTEIKNFSFQTEARFFELPKDYRKVSPKEFQEIRRREQAN